MSHIIGGGPKNNRNYCIVICSLSSRTQFPTLSHKQYDVWEKFIEHETCFDSPHKFVSDVSESKKNRARYYNNLHWSSGKVHGLVKF